VGIFPVFSSQLQPCDQDVCREAALSNMTILAFPLSSPAVALEQEQNAANRGEMASRDEFPSISKFNCRLSWGISTLECAEEKAPVVCGYT